MKKITILLFLTVFLLSGCRTQNIQPETIATEPPVTAAPTQAPTLPPTEPPTEAPTEPPTEPIRYLEIEAGTHLMKYTDEENNDYMDYYLFVPENATEDMPLFIFLHGDGEVPYPTRLENYGPMVSAKEIYGNEFPFIAVFPHTRVYSWTSATIPITLKGLLDDVIETYHINKDSVILTGHSRGSIGVWQLLSEHGDYFSAAVPISCGPGAELDLEACAKVPVLGFVGNWDEAESQYGYAMKWSIDKINEMGGYAELRVLDRVNHANTCVAAFTEEIFEWLLSQ